MTHGSRRCEDKWSEGSVFYLDDPLVVFAFLTLFMCTKNALHRCVGLTVGFGVRNPHVEERVLSRTPESTCPDNISIQEYFSRSPHWTS